MATYNEYITSGLSHFKNSTAAVNNYEPVYTNQYEMIFRLPSFCNGSDQLLLEQIITIKGLPEITPTETVTQRYKFAERVYADAAPKTTLAHISVVFEVNLANNTNDMYVYNTLRQWANIQYNPTYGSQGLKQNYVGGATIYQSNKAQKVFRVWDFKSMIFEKPFNAYDLDWTKNNGIYQLTANFVSDWWYEKRASAYDESDLLS